MRKIICITALLLIILPIVYAGNLRISSTDYAKTVNPCEPSSFSLTIQNSGSYTEVYYLSVDAFSGYTTFSQNPVQLNPSTAQQVYVFVSPGCSISGVYDFNVIVSTLNSQQQAMLPVRLNIRGNYDYITAFGNYYVENEPIVESDGYYKICEEDTQNIPLIIHNNAGLTNSYKISLNAPKFAALMQDSMVLKSSERGAVLINLHPNLGDERTYYITANVIPQVGGEPQSKKLRLDVEECYGVRISLPKEFVVSNCEQTAYTLNIHNEGKYDETFNLYLLNAPEWVSVDYNANEIKVNGSAFATLNLDVPCGVKGTERLSIAVSSQAHENVKDTKKLAIDIVPQGEFYNTVIGIIGSTKIKQDSRELPIEITNKGLKEQEYSLSIEAPDWASIEPKTLKLGQDETGNARLILSLNESVEENDYAIAINAAVGGVTFSNEVVLKLRNTFFSDKISSLFGRIWNLVMYYLYYMIVGVILLIGLVFVAKPVVRSIRAKAAKKAAKRARAAPKSAKKAGKKVKKAKSKLSKAVYITASVIAVLIVLAYAIVNLDSEDIKNGFVSFFTYYIWYLLAGLAILAGILWLLIKYERYKLSVVQSKKNSNKK